MHLSNHFNERKPENSASYKLSHDRNETAINITSMKIINPVRDN